MSRAHLLWKVSHSGRGVGDRPFAPQHSGRGSPEQTWLRSQLPKTTPSQLKGPEGRRQVGQQEADKRLPGLAAHRPPRGRGHVVRALSPGLQCHCTPESSHLQGGQWLASSDSKAVEGSFGPRALGNPLASSKERQAALWCKDLWGNPLPPAVVLSHLRWDSENLAKLNPRLQEAFGILTCHLP